MERSQTPYPIRKDRPKKYAYRTGTPDSYALWKAAREFETGEKQITLGELADREMVSDKAFRLIVRQPLPPGSGKAVLKETEE